VHTGRSAPLFPDEKQDLGQVWQSNNGTFAGAVLMWLITPIGFYSIVGKPTDQTTRRLTIRCRVRKDLESLKASALPSMGGIEEDLGTDYRFRATAKRKEIGAAITAMVNSTE
jgi:hypothetical protein